LDVFEADACLLDDGQRHGAGDAVSRRGPRPGDVLSVDPLILSDDISARFAAIQGLGEEGPRIGFFVRLSAGELKGPPAIVEKEVLPGPRVLISLDHRPVLKL